MAIRIPALLLLTLVVLHPTVAACSTPQQLLQRADSLLVAGDPYGASFLVYQALSEALQRSEAGANQNKKVWLYWVGEPHACGDLHTAEIESLFEVGVLLKQRISPCRTPELAEMIFDLAELKQAGRDNKTARRLHESALAMRYETLGRNDPDVGRSLRGLAECLRASKAYDRADSLLAESRVIFERHRELAYPDLALVLWNQAVVAFYGGRYDDAEGLFDSELAVVKKALGSHDPETIRILNGAARACEAAGRPSRNLKDLKRAEKRYREALEIAVEAYGPHAVEVADEQYRLGSLLSVMVRNNEAKDSLEIALKIRREAPEGDSLKIAECLNELAYVCLVQGSFREGEAFGSEALAIMDRRGASMDRKTAGICYTLAKTCYAQSRYSDATCLFERALQVYRKSRLPSDQTYAARCLDKLAAISASRAQYAEAERLSLEAIRMAGTTDDLANFKNTLGITYQDMGRFDEADTSYSSAMRIYEDLGKESGSEYATILNSLGALCAERGAFDRAKPYYDKALKIRRRVLGKNHVDVAVTLHNLGHLHRNLHEYSQAEKYYKQANEIRRLEFGDDHPILAESMDGLGIVYMEQGKYKQAEKQFRKALDIREKALGPRHPQVAAILESYSRYWRLQRDTEKAAAAAQRAFEIRRKSFCDNGPFLSEKRALDYAQQMRMSACNYFSCCMALDSLDTAATKEFVEAVLATKGQVSDMVFQLQRWAFGEGDSATLAICSDLRAVRDRMSGLFVSGPTDTSIGEYSRTLDSLNTVAQGLETDLAARSARFRALQADTLVTPDRIASDMPPSSELVEYLRFDFVDAKTGHLTPHYLAVVLTSGGEVSVSSLGPAATIDTLIYRYRAHMLDMATRGSGGPMPGPSDLAQYKAIATSLSKAVLGPVEPGLSRCNLLLIAPDAGLDLVSFGGLPCSDGQYLIEKTPVLYLSAARDVVRLESRAEPGEGLLAFGDPAYEALAETRAVHRWGGAAPTALTQPGAALSVDSESEQIGSYSEKRLQQSRDEVNEVVKAWAENTREPSFRFLGVDATEDNFKAVAHGKRVIHIATHGYYHRPESPLSGREPTFDAEREFVGENPLLLSGVLFAGGLLNERACESLGCDDGRLTAYEVSAMDLTGTELVVLSACETGLGEVIEGEGVYGLRRAFQMAGAREVVSTLWQVPDETARRMMQELYSSPQETLPERMRRIQTGEIEWLRQQDYPDHPFNWAQFIAIGDWR